MNKKLIKVVILSILSTLYISTALGQGKGSGNTSFQNGKPFSYLLEQIQDNTAAIEDLQLVTDEIRADVDTIRFELEALTDLVDINTQSIEGLITDVENLTDSVIRNRQEIVRLKRAHRDDIAFLRRKIAGIERDVRVLRSEIRTRISEVRAELALLKADVDANSGDINSLLVSVSSLLVDVAGLNADLVDQQSQIDDLEDAADDLEALVQDLEDAILSIDARLLIVEDAVHEHEDPNCFSFVNTAAEDLLTNDWLDNCVDMANDGDTIRVTLKDEAGNTVYDASGIIEGNWTYDQLTSTAAPSSQYFSGSQDRLIDLDNGDKLMITGRSSVNAGCGGSFGNGYGIVVYPSNPDYINNPKMIVMPYRHFNASWAGLPRYFTGWGTDNEITFDNGNSFATCPWLGGDVPAFLGTFSVSIGN